MSKYIPILISLAFGLGLGVSWHFLGLGMYLLALGGAVAAVTFLWNERNLPGSFDRIRAEATALTLVILGLFPFVFLFQMTASEALLSLTPTFGSLATGLVLRFRFPQKAGVKFVVALFAGGMGATGMLLFALHSPGCTCCAWDPEGMCEWAGGVGTWWVGWAVALLFLEKSSSEREKSGPDPKEGVQEFLEFQEESPPGPQELEGDGQVDQA